MRIILFSLWLVGCGTQEGETPSDEGANVPSKETTADQADPVSYKAPSDVSGPPDDATQTASGLAYKVIKPGKGTKNPTRKSEVEVHYIGWQTNGTMFDTSYKRGKAAKFPLSRVINGWTEGVQLMVEGEKTRFWIPENLAYKGRPGAPSEQGAAGL